MSQKFKGAGNPAAAPLVDGYTGLPTPMGYKRQEQLTQIVCGLLAVEPIGNESPVVTIVDRAERILKEIESR